MQPKQAYKTKQGEELLAYLKSMPGRHRTVAEIRAYFARQGRSIGTATIYRHLERLVEQGLVDKYTIDANSPACFAYTGHQNREQCGQHFHCKCEKCGVLIHLECEQLAEIARHVLEHHGFAVDPRRTVLYGLCQDCRTGQTLLEPCHCSCCHHTKGETHEV